MANARGGQARCHVTTRTGVSRCPKSSRNSEITKTDSLANSTSTIYLITHNWA